MDIGSASWFIAVVIGAAALGVAIGYSLWQWSKRPRDPATQQAQDRKVKDLYDRPQTD